MNTPSLHSSPDHKPNILIVEDLDLLRDLIKMRIKRTAPSAIMTFAEDGAKALKMMEGVKFDSMITDVSMPNMDGITLLNILADESKKQDPKIHVPKTKVLHSGTIEDVFEEAMQLVEHGHLNTFMGKAPLGIDAETIQLLTAKNPEALRQISEQLAKKTIETIISNREKVEDLLQKMFSKRD